MPTISPQALMQKLNPTCKKALEAAAGLCLSRTHFLVEVEHWLVKLLDSPDTDLDTLLKQYGARSSQAKKELESAINTFKTGNGRAPSLSPDILKIVQDAWVYGSLELGAHRIRSSFLLVACLTNMEVSFRLKGICPEIGRLNVEKMTAELPHILPKFQTDESYEESTAAAAEAPTGSAPGPDGVPRPGGGKTPALDQFTVNLTERARQDKIDPVVGRDAEIRQVIDILTRRRQNNPILTGEAGVGKTAVVEGLALRIASGDVPEPLKNVDLRTLDLGLLQAGAGVKGEFENRLKSVIQETKSSPKPIILFIDEAHTLIGAGGAEGQGDAANLLKPALARGELRTVAATTFAEYKKFFETDAALKRRFQQVKVDEPNEAKGIRMLRGLVPMLEKHHKVRILDQAVTDAVKLSIRYMPDRQLPDKSISLLDTVCARVSLSQNTTPPALEDVIREEEHLAAEINFLTREGQVSAGNPERLADLKIRQEANAATRKSLEAQLTKEKEVVSKIRALRESIEQAVAKGETPEKDKAELTNLTAELAKIQGETPLVYPVVDGQAVAEVLAGLTGIPLGKMVRDEVQTVLNLADVLNKRVVGQKHALDAIAQRIRTARADIGDPRRPQGVFLLVGPSGVGKTETALALVDLLYGGDRNMVTINMSEYKESHKVSRLVGSAKGYVGYGEGGVLTNAVKNRPYCVVLLDEVEKAHEGVQEIFYQVFDKGVLQNDTGEDVNFKNTIILLTANVGTDTIMKACADPDTIPSVEALGEMLRPDLLKAFKPALLGRMQVIPYFPLSETVLKSIIELQMKKIADRLKMGHKAAFEYTPAVVDAIAARCKEVETGARNVLHILDGTLLPKIAEEVLGRMAEGKPVKVVKVDVDTGGNFTYGIE